VRPWLRTGSDRSVGRNYWSAAPSRSLPPVHCCGKRPRSPNAHGAERGQNWHADAAQDSSLLGVDWGRLTDVSEERSISSFTTKHSASPETCMFISTAVNILKIEEDPVFGYGSLVVKRVVSCSDWPVSAWLTVTICRPVETSENVQFWNHCYRSAFWEDPRLRPLVLLLKAAYRWRWVWSIGGMKLTLKIQNTWTMFKYNKRFVSRLWKVVI